MFHSRLRPLAENKASIGQQIDVYIGGAGVVVNGLPENLHIFRSGNSSQPVRPHPETNRVTVVVGAATDRCLETIRITRGVESGVFAKRRKIWSGYGW